MAIEHAAREAISKLGREQPPNASTIGATYMLSPSAKD